MQEVFRAIGRLAASSVTVLITGESGTGKELIARALHEHSNRVGGPFIALNAAAIPKDLLEAELFGHERSEEHTSELQSLLRISYAVFCLKKQTSSTTHSTIPHTKNT